MSCMHTWPSESESEWAGSVETTRVLCPSAGQPHSQRGCQAGLAHPALAADHDIAAPCSLHQLLEVGGGWLGNWLSHCCLRHMGMPSAPMPKVCTSWVCMLGAGC